MTPGQRIRARRVVAGIPGRVLCSRAGISRGRLSDLERGYISISAAEQGLLEAALDQLIEARRRIESLAAEVGWPAGSEGAIK